MQLYKLHSQKKNLKIVNENYRSELDKTIPTYIYEFWDEICTHK